MGKRELVDLLSLSSWCFVMVVWLFLAVPWICLGFVIVVFADHTHYFGNATITNGRQTNQQQREEETEHRQPLHIA